MSFLREKHRDLPVYVPGTHEEGGTVIRLNTNESPYPPSQAVLEAIYAAAPGLNYYNDPDCTQLLRALAEQNSLKPENVMAGNGSDQVLYLSVQAFADENCPIYLPDITYSYYELFAAVSHVPLHRIPLESDFSLDPAKLEGRDGMVLFPNPNAPTGLALPLEAIRKIAKSNPDHVVVIDEAYVHFGAESAAALIPECPNLLVVRTFSKSGSLAGLRLGYALGDAALISDLNRLRNGMDLYGVNRLAQAAGVAACKDWAYYEANCSRIMESRTWATGALEALGFTVIPSKGNFIFARPAGIGAAELKAKLAKENILVRHFNEPRVRDWLRITVGRQEEMEALANACARILSKQGS